MTINKKFTTTPCTKSMETDSMVVLPKALAVSFLNQKCALGHVVLMQQHDFLIKHKK